MLSSALGTEGENGMGMMMMVKVVHSLTPPAPFAWRFFGIQHGPSGRLGDWQCPLEAPAFGTERMWPWGFLLWIPWGGCKVLWVELPWKTAPKLAPNGWAPSFDLCCIYPTFFSNPWVCPSSLNIHLCLLNSTGY